MEYDLSNKSKIHLYLYTLVPSIDLIKYIYNITQRKEYETTLIDRYNIVIKQDTIHWNHEGNYLSIDFEKKYTDFVKIDHKHMSSERIMESIEKYELFDKHCNITYLGEFDNYNNYKNVLLELKILHDKTNIRSIQASHIKEYHIQKCQVYEMLPRPAALPLHKIIDGNNRARSLQNNTIPILTKIRPLKVYYNYCNNHCLFRTNTSLIYQIYIKFRANQIKLFYDETNKITYLSKSF